MADSGRSCRLICSQTQASAHIVSTTADPLSDQAMAHLKTYKYQSVDKSLISNHILRHYVNLPSDSPQPKRD